MPEFDSAPVQLATLSAVLIGERHIEHVLKGGCVALTPIADRSEVDAVNTAAIGWPFRLA